MSYHAYGIDYTGGLHAATLDRATINGHPISFVCRYLSGFSKDLTPAEARDLTAAGLDIVVVWETTATRAEAGHAAGVADARAALAEARRCGMPDGRPIYMAVDEDTTVGPHLTTYFHGAASVLGLDRTGAYGGYAVIKGLFDAGLIQWGWQTYAWSGGRWDHRAQLQQYSNGHRISGADVDYDRATTSDFGQWRVGVTPQPQEDTMPYGGQLPAGKGQQINVSFPRGSLSAMGLVIDNSLAIDGVIAAEPQPEIRYAIHRYTGHWQTGTVKAGSKDGGADHSPKVVVHFDHHDEVDWFSLVRLDDGGRPVGWDAS